MAKIKTLFPPIVPSSLPAFNKDEDLKYYFKPSVANTMDQVLSIQISIVRLDTNRNELDSVVYPYGLMFIPKSQIKFDINTGYYHVVIKKEIFKTVNTPYKIQLRLSEVALPSDITGPTMGDWIKTNLDKFSEWSIVTIVKPILPPEFGIVNMLEDQDNKVDSSLYNFIGYYSTTDLNKEESLSLFRFNIYTYTVFEDKNTWKLFDTSGDMAIGIYERPNLMFSPTKDLQQNAKYVITFSVRSKNLYSKTKVYKFDAAYPTIEIFNSLQTEDDDERGSIRLTVNAKQILLKSTKGANLTFIKEEPGYQSYPNIKGTHAMLVEGEVFVEDKFFMINQDSKYVIQTRLRDFNVYESTKDAHKNPTLEIKYNAKGYDNYSYYTKIKLFALKINLAYPTSSDLNPEPEWEYRFVLRKEVVEKEYQRGEKILFTQERMIRLDEAIDEKQEYYFYIREDEGLLEFKSIKTYKAN